MDPFPPISENVLFGKGDVERVSNVSINQRCATDRCAADRQLSNCNFNVFVAALLDIGCWNQHVSPFCHFLVF